MAKCIQFRDVVAMVAWVSIVAAVGLALLILCDFIDPSFRFNGNENVGLWSLQPQDTQYLPTAKRLIQVNDFDDLPTAGATTKKPKRRLTGAKDMELDSPTLYEITEPSTNRFPIDSVDPLSNIFLDSPPRDVKDVMSKIIQIATDDGRVQAECAKESEGKGAADPTWCRRFFYCYKGLIYVYLCPEKSVFRPQIRACDFKKEGDCRPPNMRLGLPTWRNLMMTFYMTNNQTWIRDTLLKNLAPPTEVTFPTESTTQEDTPSLLMDK